MQYQLAFIFFYTIAYFDFIYPHAVFVYKYLVTRKFSGAIVTRYFDKIKTPSVKEATQIISIWPLIAGNDTDVETLRVQIVSTLKDS